MATVHRELKHPVLMRQLPQWSKEGQMTTQEQWMDKVAKLLAKAERAGTQEEADTFYGKAQELMVKWSIDEAMLQASGKSKDEIIREAFEMKRNGLFRAFVELWSAVAAANDVKLLVRMPSQWSKPGVELIGWKSDVEKVKMLWQSLMIHSSAERNGSVPEELRQQPGWSNTAEVTRWRKSFQMGYAHRIRQRLLETKKTVERKATKGDNSVALAVRDKAQAVEDFYEAIPKGKGRASRMKMDYTAANAGRQAADKADIGLDKLRQQGKLGK